MEKKTTKRENFAILTELVANSNHPNKTELLGFIDHEVELLEKKSSKSTMTATQKANIEVKKIIEQVLGKLNEPVTVTELNKTAELTDYSSQKISALLKQMVDDKIVTRVADKKTARFTLADKATETAE